MSDLGRRTRKRVTFTLDEASGKALDCAARALHLSRTELVGRLANFAWAAAFIGLDSVPEDADDETSRRAAEDGCESMGLFTLGTRWRPENRRRRDLRVVRGGGEGGAA